MPISSKKHTSTIDEKIESLIEWRAKYPEATTTVISNEMLSKYAKTEEERKQLFKEYDKMLKYYAYIRTRRIAGKLTEEQIKRCQEGNIGGVFEKEIKANQAIDENEKLMKKYDLNEEDINLIRKRYGSISEFRDIYIDAVINQSIDQDIDKKILENVKLIKGFDISSRDWVLRNDGFTDLIYDISYENRKPIFIRCKGLEEKMLEIINNSDFSEQERQVLCMRYGINGEKKMHRGQIAQNIGKSVERVRQITGKAVRKIMYPTRSKKLDIENRIAVIDYDIQTKIIKEYFNNFDVFVSKEPTNMDKDVKMRLTNMLLDGIKKTTKRKEQIYIIQKMPIEQRLDILRARFGEKINSSSFSIIPSWHPIIQNYFEDHNDIDIKKLVSIPEIYVECVDSEYTQSKIEEFMMTNSSNSQLTEVDQKKELVKRILEQQSIIAKQQKIINELSSQQKEEIDE